MEVVLVLVLLSCPPELVPPPAPLPSVLALVAVPGTAQASMRAANQALATTARACSMHGRWWLTQHTCTTLLLLQAGRQASMQQWSGSRLACRHASRGSASSSMQKKSKWHSSNTCTEGEAVWLPVDAVDSAALGPSAVPAPVLVPGVVGVP